jgi:soluble lytic murein transglycosylase-like protein
MIKAHHILLLTALLVYPHVALATIYKCVGSNGQVRFTDTLESKLCSPISLKGRGAHVTPGSEKSSSIYLEKQSTKYDRLIHYYGVRYNIDPHLIRAVIRTESAFNPRAVSQKGAQGLMQLMPATARELKVSNPFDPEENISGGTRYLRSLLDTFQQDVRLALAAYNAGPTVVRKSWSVPEFPETVQYIKRVLSYYREYKSGAA